MCPRGTDSGVDGNFIGDDQLREGGREEGRRILRTPKIEKLFEDHFYSPAESRKALGAYTYILVLRS